MLLYESRNGPSILKYINEILNIITQKWKLISVQKTAYDFFLSSTACEKLFK